MSVTTVNGSLVKHGSIFVPVSGAGRIVLNVEADKQPTGLLSVRVGERSIVATVDERKSGEFVNSSFVVATFGAGGWHKSIPRKDYKNDFGVLRRTVIEQAAADCGETLESTDVTPIGGDYVRTEGPAADALAQLATSWRVDFDGITRYGERTPYAPEKLEVLTFDPVTREIVCACEDELAVRPGAVITDPRFGSLVAGDVRIFLDANGSRIHVSTTASPNRLAALIQMLARKPSDALAGLHRYRVRSSTEKVADLEIVEPKRGLPALAAARMWPGLAGAQFELTQGAIVLVAFTNHDPTGPVIVAFEGPGIETTFRPETLNLDAINSVSIGSTADRVVCGQEVAGSGPASLGRFVRYGDAVAVGASTGTMTFVAGGLGTAGT